MWLNGLVGVWMFETDVNTQVCCFFEDLVEDV